MCAGSVTGVRTATDLTSLALGFDYGLLMLVTCVEQFCASAVCPRSGPTAVRIAGSPAVRVGCGDIVLVLFVFVKKVCELYLQKMKGVVWFAGC